MSKSETDSPRCRLFNDPKWLNYHHGGYELAPLDEYLSLRQAPRLLGDKQTSETDLEFAAKHQSLLTFGLVEAVTESLVPEEMLLRENEKGKLVMTTRNLPTIIRGWIGRVGQLQRDARKSWLERSQKALGQADNLLKLLTSPRHRMFQPLGEDETCMAIFIRLVGEALGNAAKVFPPAEQPFPFRGQSWIIHWKEGDLHHFRNMMIQQNWCPFTVEYLLKLHNISSLKWASGCSLPPDGRDHGGCATDGCAAYRIDAETYTQKHTQTCGGSSDDCSYSKPDLDEIIQHISQDSIPVVSLDGECEGGTMRLKVHKSSDTPYVAISHVWADGLGSNSETGLPACQVRRLAALVTGHAPSIAFWIDSLCIPKDATARRKAIKMMARTYEEAQVVLVLDAGLQLCQSTEASGVNVLSVLTSGWMRRLWTLQEAALAQHIIISFADKQVPLEDLIPKGAGLSLSPAMTDLSAELFRLLTYKAGRYKIGDISRSLRWRGTSRPSDETLAIASLLGVDPSVLLNFSEEQADERMVKLFQELKELPRNIALLPGLKLKVPGFRWAPKSLMGVHGEFGGGMAMSTAENDAVCTPRGLRARYMAFCFTRRIVEKGSAWSVRNPKNERVYDVRTLSDGDESHSCDILLINEALARGGAAAGIAVLSTSLSIDDGNGFCTVYCEYKRRMSIVDLMEDDNEMAEDLRAVGHLNVCIS